VAVSALRLADTAHQRSAWAAYADNHIIAKLTLKLSEKIMVRHIRHLFTERKKLFIAASDIIEGPRAEPILSAGEILYSTQAVIELENRKSQSQVFHRRAIPQNERTSPRDIHVIRVIAVSVPQFAIPRRRKRMSSVR